MDEINNTKKFDDNDLEVYDPETGILYFTFCSPRLCPVIKRRLKLRVKE